MKKKSNKVIEGGTLIDGTGRGPRENVVIIVEGDKIKAVDKKGKVRYPSNAEIINAEDKFILPGLIDMHTHYRDWTAELLMTHGITTICDLGNLTEWILAIKDAVAKGKIPNHPRVFCVGPILNGLPIEGPGSIYGFQIGLENPEHAKRVVREVIAKGIEGVKLYWNTPIDICKVIAEECQRAGITVSAHLNPCVGNISDAREIARAGIDCLTHASGIGLANIRDPEKRRKFKEETLPKIPSGKFPHYVWVSDPANEPWYWMEPECYDETIEILLKEDVYINPTLVFPWKCVHGRQEEFDRDVLDLSRNPNLSYVPAYFFSLYLDYAGCNQLTLEEKENLQKGYKRLQEFLKRFVKAGGKILPGSDPVHSGVPGLGIHQEMRLLIDAGLSPMEVIVGATKHSAEFIRKSNELGTVEESKLADIIIVKENPLKDIGNLKKVEMVLKNGELMEIGYHRDFRHPLPRPFYATAFDEIGCHQRIDFYNSISPEVVTEGGGDFVLLVNGENFFRTSIVTFNGVKLSTEFINVTQLRAEVPSSLIKDPGVFPITVYTPFRGETNTVHIVVKFQ